MWKDGHRHGEGVYTGDGGWAISGIWHDGRLERGHGRYRLDNGDVYEGEWRKDRFWGRGIYTAADGKTIDGLWKANRYMGPAPENGDKTL
jgi:hypothetical protein